MLRRLLFFVRGKIMTNEKNKSSGEQVLHLSRSRRQLEDPAHREELHAEQAPPTETGGPSGPEPTRYGDWERKGRCIDF